MAILSGAGNPVGGSFTGPAEALEIIGSHCFAYSGSITPAGASNPDTTALLFTTGNYYATVTINWTSTSTSATVDQYFRILMNDSIIFDAQSEDDEAATQQSPVELILPSYTKFELKVGDPATNPFTVVLAGRIYRNE